MVSQIPQFTLPVPNTLEQTADEFESSVNTFVSEVPVVVDAMNQAILEVNQKSLDVGAASEGITNQAWVSGTTYIAGQVRYSPADFLNYRRKTNGAGTTDPSLDPTNWALLTKTSAGGSDVTSSAVDITLLSTSNRLQQITMTASGKKVTLPAATGVAKGSPTFVIKNAGNYRFAVRKNGGAFLCFIYPGQTLALGCADNSTSAGTWTISGGDIYNIFDGNTPEILNAVDSREISVAMLTPTKAICCYKNNTSTFLNAVILNFGSASGTPVVVSAEAVRNVTVAALSATKAVVVYQLTGSNTSIKAYVLDISGNTITPGSVQTIITIAASGNEGTDLAVISSTQLLMICSRSGVSGVRERVLDISGTTITAGTEVSSDTTDSASLYMQTEIISSTKAVVAFLSGNAASQTVLRLQTISGSTLTPSGSALLISPPSSSTPYSSIAVCVMDAGRAVVLRSVSNGIIAYIIDIAGTSPILKSSRKLSLDFPDGTIHIYATRLDSSRIYVTWVNHYNFTINAQVIQMTGDDQIVTVGEVQDYMESGVSQSFKYLACEALDSTHVMQVCRGAATFLTAKTIEISL